jgi:predicted nucleic acid-binding protein
LIVVDASVVIELLLNTTAGEAIAERVLDPDEQMMAPHLLDVEVLQVLRRYSRAGEVEPERGLQAVTDLAGLPVARYPHEPFLTRAWVLRNNLTAYDAMYVALAEALGAELLTRDRRLASTQGHGARITLV